MTLFYLKLMTGEEIIGSVHRRGQTVAVEDPMTLDYSEGEGKRFVYMGRYNPFAESKTIFLDRRNVLWMRPVLDAAADYYWSSLNYSRAKADAEFRRGLRVAAKMSHESLEDDKVDHETVDPLDGLDETSTIH